MSLLPRSDPTSQNRTNQSGQPTLAMSTLPSSLHPQPKSQGYPERVRQQAMRLYVDGMNLRRIARHLGVVHQTVANWVQAYAASLPVTPPQPDTVTVIEQDELYTFVEAKKTKSIS